MLQVVTTIFLIFGTIVGAGFASGNEIVVYFSRFGDISYFYIFVASVLLFFLFFFFLHYGKHIVKKIENSKILNFIVTIISIVFSASMYAGIDGLLSYFPKIWKVVMMTCVLALCLLVTMKGIGGLEKFNLFLMPILGVLFFVVLLFCTGLQSSTQITNSQSFFGILFCPLYVALNTSMNLFVMSKQGEKLSKKQAVFASLFSAILLFVFLVLCNFVLLQNPESYAREMPVLFLVKDEKIVFVLEFFVILIGCFSTLISLCFTLKNSLKKLIKNNYLTIFSSVFLPYILCGVGFSRIILFFYPICSVFGIFILLFSIFSFKQTDEIIHAKSKHTQNRC